MDSRDLADMKEDVSRIDEVLQTKPTTEVLHYARELDQALRLKHPIIEEMLTVAEKMPKQPARVDLANPAKNNEPVEYKRLRQDRYGIICEVLIKKLITERVEQIISRVTDD